MKKTKTTRSLRRVGATPRSIDENPSTRGNVGGSHAREQGRDSEDDPNTRDVTQGDAPPAAEPRDAPLRPRHR